MNETIMCGKPAAFVMTGIGGRSVKVCLDCAEKGKTIAGVLGIQLALDPDVSGKCEQRSLKNRAIQEPTQ